MPTSDCYFEDGVSINNCVDIRSLISGVCGCVCVHTVYNAMEALDQTLRDITEKPEHFGRVNILAKHFN